MKLQVDNGAILAYQRLSYRPWYAIAEFVDNSIDSYLRGGNRELLDEIFKQEGSRLEVEVSYDRQSRLLRIEDNSIGMSHDELEKALVIGSKPTNSAGLSEFGMGMKTSAIWFADIIDIRTKKYGDTHETRVTINVPEFASGNDDLQVTTTKKSEKDHYTVIELREVKRKLGAVALSKTKTYLGSIYREFLREDLFGLHIDGDAPYVPPSRSQDEAFMLRSDGSPLVVDVHIDVNGKLVTGWVGVLRPGKTDGFTGRSNAGFALLRFKRAVSGWIDSWRPEEIFGEARNDTLNQRLAGELYLDAFRSSHTKDAIDWEDDDEEVLGRELQKLCKQYNLLLEAKKNVRDKDRSEQEERERLEALEQLQAQLNDQKVSDVISFLDVPTPELALVQSEPLTRVLEEAETIGIEPVTVWTMGNSRKASLYEQDLSPNDPYYYFEVLAHQDLRIIVNSAHPALRFLDSAEARLAHYHHVVIDAIAEWHVTQQNSQTEPNSIRLMKDRLFRSVAEYNND